MITNVKKKIRPDFWTQQIHCSNRTFSFPCETSHEEFVSRPLRVIALCIPTVYHFTRKMHAHLRERKISCSFFFCQEEKLWSPRKRTWWPTIHIFCLQSSEKLEKNIFHTISNLGEKQRHSLKMKSCKGTCSTCTVVSHSLHMLKKLEQIFSVNR